MSQLGARETKVMAHGGNQMRWNGDLCKARETAEGKRDMWKGGAGAERQEVQVKHGNKAGKSAGHRQLNSGSMQQLSADDT